VAENLHSYTKKERHFNAKHGVKSPKEERASTGMKPFSKVKMHFFEKFQKQDSSLQFLQKVSFSRRKGLAQLGSLLFRGFANLDFG
jgi:hypothetical protein